MGILGTMRFLYQHPLCREERRWKTILRFFRWQFATRALNLPVLVPFINGTRLIAERGVTCASGSYYVGLIEFSVMVFTMHYLRPEDLFVDAGANVGTFTVLAAGGVGTRCISIEPADESYERLVRNINLNCLNDRVVTVNAGLGESVGKLHFTYGLDATNHVLRRNDELGETVLVEITTLDDILADQNPEMIKIDVEGYESQVLLGAQHLFASSRSPNVVIMELRGHGARYGSDEKDVHRRMLSYGYKPYEYVPVSRTLTPWQPHQKDTLGDMIYIREADKAKHRIREARKFSVLERAI